MPARHDLIEMTPEEAVDLFLQERSTESADSTIQSYRYRLQHFVRWCDGIAEVDNLNDLSGRDLHKYKLWRQEDGGSK